LCKFDESNASGAHFIFFPFFPSATISFDGRVFSESFPLGLFLVSSFVVFLLSFYVYRIENIEN